MQHVCIFAFRFQVNITFPDPDTRSDVVTLRGPKNNVEKCFKYLKQMNDDMVRKLLAFVLIQWFLTGGGG